MAKAVKFYGEVEVRGLEEGEKSDPTTAMLFKVGVGKFPFRLTHGQSLIIGKNNFLASLNWDQARLALVGEEVVVEGDGRKYAVKKILQPEEKKTVACVLIRSEKHLAVKKDWRVCKEGVDDGWTGMMFNVGKWYFIHYYRHFVWLDEKFVGKLLNGPLYRELTIKVCTGAKRQISLTRKCADCPGAATPKKKTAPLVAVK